MKALAGIYVVCTVFTFSLFAQNNPSTAYRPIHEGFGSVQYVNDQDCLMDLTSAYNAARMPGIDGSPDYSYAGWGYITQTKKDGSLVVYNERGTYTLSGKQVSCTTARGKSSWSAASEMVRFINNADSRSLSTEARNKISKAEKTCSGSQRVALLELIGPELKRKYELDQVDLEL